MRRVQEFNYVSNYDSIDRFYSVAQFYWSMNLDCSTRKSTNLPQELVKVRENNNGNQE
jgi:hypothetical protein